MQSISLPVRYKNRKLLVENRIAFGGPASELSIYDTYRQANNVALIADQLMYCGMISGKKIMHDTDSGDSEVFLPHESYILRPKGRVEIDFPEAREKQPTTCLTIEISSERIRQVSESMEQVNASRYMDVDWQYTPASVHLHHTEDTQQLIQRLFTLFTTNDPDKEMLINFGVSELVVRLLRQQSRSFLLAYASEQPDANSITTAIDYLRQHLDMPFNIDNLTQISCMSRSKLYGEFQKLLGCSPAKFLWQCRLEKATRLLLQGHTISYTCYESGFNDLPHFCHRFQQTYGCSPSQYRKKHTTIGDSISSAESAE